MPAHQRDIDADFLAIYGIDLNRDEIDGPRYFALAHRLTAYQGVLAARVEEEKEQRQGPLESAGPATAAEPRRARNDGESREEVSLTAFRVQFPGLVSMATSG